MTILVDRMDYYFSRLTNHDQCMLEVDKLKHGRFFIKTEYFDGKLKVKRVTENCFGKIRKEE